MTTNHGSTANQRNRRLAQDVDEAENGLAQIIGQAVALHLSQVLQEMLPQLPWQTACLACVHAHKLAEARYLEQYGALPEADRPPFTGPPIQQSMTWAPLTTAPNVPPVPAPTCYQHLNAGPALRQTGLVLPDGSPVIARA